MQAMILRRVVYGIALFALWFGWSGQTQAQIVDQVQHQQASLFQVNEAVEVLWNGRWYPAHVLAVVNAAQWRIHYDGYESSWDENIGPDRIRKPQGAVIQPGSLYNVGDAVQVEWHGQWYPAHVLAVVGGTQWRIHYDGYESSWDENVGPERIRKPQANIQVYPLYQVGDAVQVLWNGQWYPAHVIQVVRPGEWRIHYDGYDASWDENVGADRIRKP